jgi:cyclopropane-fatty-acyl-phospholipid synthase
MIDNSAQALDGKSPNLGINFRPIWYERWLEKDVIPDWLIRVAIRHIISLRLQHESEGNVESQQARFMRFLSELRASPIAIHTDSANDQHYEVPAEFYRLVLGWRMKYSCGYWPDGTDTLDEAEDAMLELTCRRARLGDGQSILELGCGWGSLSMYMARRHPASSIVAVSNSKSQKAFIDEQCRARGITNLEVITADMNDFHTERRFDRVVSVEMFEHMRNYRELMARISSWTKWNGLLFVHIFSHNRLAYPYEVKDASDWMSQHFFTGGVMPSDQLLLYFQDDFAIRDHWVLDGSHYQKTARAWLQNQDANREEILKLFEGVYGKAEALKWWVRWRVFFMACEELWRYRKGSEWILSHYLFENRN